ncbi:DUF1385 domain-containing protein, partial [Acidobacteriota bacterium]
LGMKALSYSADKAMEAEKEKEADKSGREAEGTDSVENPGKDMEESEGKSLGAKIAMAATIAFSFVLGIGLFVLTSLIFEPPGSWQELLAMMKRSDAEQTFTFNIVDGVIRILIFVGYIAVLSAWGEFRRIFQYHGAEHKTIHAYENNEPITVDNTRKYSTLHPRCGTSFIFVVMVISILVFSLVRSDLFVVKFGSRIVLIPLIAGIGYEIIKFSAKHKNNRLCRILITPGLWLQRLSTREPTDDMLEVAISALEAALALERETKTVPREEAAPAGTG